MKLLQFILLFLALFLLNSCNDSGNTGNTSYYFCFSRPINQQEDSSTDYLFYTDVQKITGDEKVIKEKTREWYELIENICKSANGCTSDLNKYNSLQEAETGRNQMLENYKNQNKYNLEMVEFK
ncbi:MAG: hypothetical protein IPO62_08890 [Saprospiraceae bacterium]|nr:hypothetical protein [Saprospiraceae bacterium]MBK9631170.1 hypothetical protein [Saprospiraceae bacterium]